MYILKKKIKLKGIEAKLIKMINNNNKIIHSALVIMWCHCLNESLVIDNSSPGGSLVIWQSLVGWLYVVVL